jgi:hypothetical protein
MKTRIIRALMTALVAGLIAVAGTAPYIQPGTLRTTVSAGS